MSEIKIDFNKIVKNNPKVNASDLDRNLKLIREVERNGVNCGPNYKLTSPYSRLNETSKKK